MKRLLLISDPIGGPTSVQFDLIASLVTRLRTRYNVAYYAPYCDPLRSESLTRLNCDVLIPRGRRFFIDRMLHLGKVDNESMLWAESWLREAVLSKNSSEADEVVRPGRFDYVVNLSMTVPVQSDLWWILGTPLDQTLRGMAGTNIVARLVQILGARMLTRLDERVMHEVQARARNVVANSPFLRDLYRQRGVPAEGVVYTLTELSEFVPTDAVPNRDYVLVYLGKETELIDFAALKHAGLPIVAFGSKIPAGSSFRSLKHLLDFRGGVSREMLVALYSNALFTLFPFTCEPMGLVPIESMACGTPVLTYNRQGPASTVLDGVTGWLVDSPDQLVAKAVQLWRNGTTGISSEMCIRRAQEFTVSRSVDELMIWIDGPRRPVQLPATKVGARPHGGEVPVLVH